MISLRAYKPREDANACTGKRSLNDDPNNNKKKIKLVPSEGFSILPNEVALKILSYMNLQTLFNTAHSFAGASYTICNEYACSILNIKNKDSGLIQLLDNQIKVCNTLSQIYTETTGHLSSQILRSNLTLEDSLVKLQKTVNTFEFLINQGAKISLKHCLELINMPSMTIEQILNKNTFTDTICLTHVYSAIVNKRSDKVIRLLLDKVNDKNNYFLCNPYECLHYIVFKSNLTEPTIVEIINKAKKNSLKEIASLIMSPGLTEPLVAALLENVEIHPSIDKKSLESLTDYITSEVVHKKTYSPAILESLINVYTKAGIKFNDVKHHVEPKLIYLQFTDEKFILALIKNNEAFAFDYLEMAIKHRATPECILKIYNSIKSQNKHESFPMSLIMFEALKYMFNSKSYDVIVDLIQHGKYPDGETIKNAICEERGEVLINLLLDAYEKNNVFFVYHHKFYLTFLDEAKKHNLSPSTIEKIKNQADEASIKVTEQVNLRAVSQNPIKI